MKLNKLIQIVEFIYNEVHNEKVISINYINNLIIELNFANEVIKVDKLISNRYRITFESSLGTIEQFNLFIDEALNFILYCCDISNYIDLTSFHINKIIKHYKIQ